MKVNSIKIKNKDLEFLLKMEIDMKLHGKMIKCMGKVKWLKLMELNALFIILMEIKHKLKIKR